jgi:hypothetical protein
MLKITENVCAPYDSCGPPTAACFSRRCSVTETLEKICESPNLFPNYDGSIRRIVLPRFPYTVYYEVKPDRVVVL